MKFISYITALLVGLLALGAFTLSYAALYDTAQQHSNISPRLLWIWPLLIDFALVVFSMAVLRANLLAERAAWPWVLVGLFTVATVAFNLIHAPANLTGRMVAVVAPLALFLSFETLMGMLKNEIRRAGAIHSLTAIQQQAATAAQSLADLQQQLDDMAARKGQLKTELSQLRREKRHEENESPAETSPDVYEQARLILAERGDITGSELGRKLGKSESLGRRLKRELSLNGTGVNYGNSN